MLYSDQANLTPLLPIFLERNEREAAQHSQAMDTCPGKHFLPSHLHGAAIPGPQAFLQSPQWGLAGRRHSGLYCSSQAKKVPDEVYEVMATEARHFQGCLLRFNFAFRKSYFGKYQGVLRPQQTTDMHPVASSSCLLSHL